MNHSYLLLLYKNFRMAADEIDAIDIEKVVNDSYSIECIPDGEYCFRRESPKISVAEVCLYVIMFRFQIYKSICINHSGYTYMTYFYYMYEYTMTYNFTYF